MIGYPSKQVAGEENI